MTVRIDRVIIPGHFILDGKQVPVENNVWVAGDERECLVIDAAHDAAPILQAVAGRSVVGIACTHGHSDHIGAALALREAVAAPVWLHAGDRMLWDRVHDTEPDGELHDGRRISVAGVELEIFNTPGHSPGSVCLYAPALSTLFSGDTLFQGGPGATGGRPFSNFLRIISSIRHRLLVLPPETAVHTGHGDTTTIGAEAPHLEEWIARGY